MQYEIKVNVEHPSYGDGWHLAEGGDLPARVWVKIGRSPGGRWECTEVDIDSDRPITSSVLRTIPMSDIVDRLVQHAYSYLDRGGPLDLSTGLREWYDGGSLLELTADEFAAGGLTASLSSSELQALYLENGTTHAPRPKHGGRGPTDAEMERFARAYEIARQTDRRRAIARTLEILEDEGFVISRATAIRWRDRFAEDSRIESVGGAG